MIDFKEYYSFSKKYKHKLSYQKCIIEIHKILHNYSRDQLLFIISDIAISLGLESDEEIILILQRRYLNISEKIYIIHRQAICILFQFVVEYRIYPRSNYLVVIRQSDLFHLFILINELLDRTYDSIQNITDETKRVFFHSVRSFNDVLSTSDIQATIYIYKELYKNIEFDLIFKDDITHFESTFGLTFSEYLAYFDKMEKHLDTKSIFEMLKNNFSLSFDNLNNAWDNRTFPAKPPFEYKFLQEYPILNNGDKFYIVNVFNIFLAFIMRAYYILCNPDKTKRFKEKAGKFKFEPLAIQMIKNSFLYEKTSAIMTETDEYEYSDFGMVKGNQIFLFEIKSGTIPINLKFGLNVEGFYNDIYKKFINKEGITQQVERLIDIDINLEKFCKVANLTVRRDYEFYPYIVFLEEAFGSIPANKFMKREFRRVLKEKKHVFKNISIKNNINSIITFKELYLFMRISNIINEDKLKILSDFPFYNLSFREFVESKDYEEIFCSRNEKQKR